MSYFVVYEKRAQVAVYSFLFRGEVRFRFRCGKPRRSYSSGVVGHYCNSVAAKLFGEISERCGLPSVLGELVGGIILGNLVLLNPALGFFEPLRITPIQGYWPIAVDSLARLGVIILLFEVGLESTVKGMMKVGASSFIVAVLGVIAPLILGFGVSWFFIRNIPIGLSHIVPAGFSLFYVHLFIGSVLCATSVGITARVFKDLGKLQMKEAQIILGAAVIDDVLGLIVLAVVSGIVTSCGIGTAGRVWLCVPT